MKRIVLTYGNARKAVPYAEALWDVRLEPVLVSAAGSVRSMDGFDGLLLSGGTDINPQLYGEAPGRYTQPADVPRDTLEMQLLHDALARDIPVLAICRGMQLFNVAHPGGTLCQHIEGHEFRPPDASDPAHVAAVRPETKLAAIVESANLHVNSRHHQAVAKPGAPLIVSAVAPDGVIEGLEHPDRQFAIAVQWHPEDQLRFEAQRRLFARFAAAVVSIDAASRKIT